MKLLNLLTLFIPLCLTNSLELIELTPTNMVSIRGPINAFSASKFIHDTNSLQSDVFNIIINSPGGSISDGNIMIEQIKNMNETNIKVNCISEFAASMAFIITQACPNRYGMSSSVMMQHQMSLGINGELNRITSYLEYINSMRLAIDMMQSKRIGMKLDDFQNKVKDEWWVYGSDNIKYNILDDIIILKCSNSLNKHEDKVKINSMFGEVVLTYVGCPLVREPSKIIWNNINKEKALELAYKYISSPQKFIEYSI